MNQKQNRQHDDRTALSASAQSPIILLGKPPAMPGDSKSLTFTGI